MRQAMSSEEFAELVGLPLDVIETYRAHGLLDPEDDGLFDDVDLVRIQFVSRQLAFTDHTPQSLGAAVREEQVDRMYGGQLFEAGSLTIEDAADRSASNRTGSASSWPRWDSRGATWGHPT